MNLREFSPILSPEGERDWRRQAWQARGRKSKEAHMKRIGLIAAAALLAAGCADGQGLTNQQVGAVGGAVVGGVVGSQFGGGSGKTAATIAGAVVGGAVGSEVGRNMQ
jgi:outer membrane lipoprotein SlyB